jgi:hypothetical protein
MAILKKKDVTPMAKASKPPVKTTPSTPGMKRALGVDSVESGKMYPFKKKTAATKTVKVLKSSFKEVPTKRVPVKVLKSSFKEVSKMK